MCFIVGEEEAFKSACKKLEITIRESVINDLLSKKEQKNIPENIEKIIV
jgi:exodeoxyribonuclease V alpha subunit